MNYFILLAALTQIFYFINAMDISPKTSSLWGITQDSHLVEIDTTIAQQSNLLTVLQETGKGTPHDPLPIPTNKESFTFLCSTLAIQAQQLSEQLTAQDYSRVMDIADKLKCIIFYAELMEQIIPTKDLISPFLLKVTTISRLLKKSTYKHFLEKKCIKKSQYHTLNDVVSSYSPNGDYFFENIPKKDSKYRINLWNTEKRRCIKIFPHYSKAVFSPSNDYIILYGRTIPKGGLLLLYSIVHDQSITLLSSHLNHLWGSPIISPEGDYIIQNIDQGYLLITYKNGNKIEKMILQNEWFYAITCCFSPDNNHIIYGTKDNDLHMCDVNDPYAIQSSIKCDNLYTAEIGQWNNAEPSLLMIKTNNHKKSFFTLQDDQLALTKKISSKDSYRSVQHAFITSKKIDCYNKNATTLCIMDTENKLLLCTEKMGPSIAQIIADTIGNHVVSLHKESATQPALSTLAFWNISHFPDRLTKITYPTKDIIDEMQFHSSGLLLTQGPKIELWDMQGDKVLNLGQGQNYALHPTDGSMLLSHSIANKMHDNTPRKTKLYLLQPQTKAAMACLEDIQKSLTLSQILLCNEHSPHRKDKKQTRLSPNMPDGRALASFKPEHAFLAEKFILSTQDFIPTDQLIFQWKKLPHGQS